MPRAAMFKAEVLLDRLDISPGIVDGKAGENAGKAIVAFQRSRGLAASGKLDQATWDKLCESPSAPVLIAYTITDDDVRGPFVPKIPRDFEGMARLHGLGYRSAVQLLSEKFHTSEELIKLLNPGKTLDRSGNWRQVAEASGAARPRLAKTQSRLLSRRSAHRLGVEILPSRIAQPLYQTNCRFCFRPERRSYASS